MMYQMGTIFAMMAVGFAANKLSIMDDLSNRKISKLLVTVTIPALIISSSINNTDVDLTSVGKVLLVATLLFVGTAFLSHYFVKWFQMGKTYELMLNYSNLGFMGIPIVTSLYGESSVFYVSLFMMVFNISLFSHGIQTLQYQGDQRKLVKNSLNAGSISALVAILLFLGNVPVPYLVMDVLSGIGNVTTPLAMLVIGSTSAEVELGDFQESRKLLVYTSVKLILYPVLAYVILGFFIQDAQIVGISTVLWALPTAGNVSMICSEYDGDMELVTKGILTTTIGSILTIPFLMHFLF